MKNAQAFRTVNEMLIANRSGIDTFEGVLNRFRVAALNRLMSLAEPEYKCIRRGRWLVAYERLPVLPGSEAKYKQIGAIRLPVR